MNSEQFGSVSDYNGYNKDSEYNQPDATRDDVGSSHFEPSMPDEQDSHNASSDEEPRWIGDFANTIANDLNKEDKLRKRAATVEGLNNIHEPNPIKLGNDPSGSTSQESTPRQGNETSIAEPAPVIDTTKLTPEELNKEIDKSRKIAFNNAADELEALEKKNDDLWEALEDLKYTEAELDKTIETVNKLKERISWLHSFLNKLRDELDEPNLVQRPEQSEKAMSETEKLKNNSNDDFKKTFYSVKDSLVATDPGLVRRGEEGGMPPENSSGSTA